MREIETDIFIHATLKTVWETFIDFESYPDWNPFIKAIKGEPVSGDKISVTLQAAERDPMTFNTKVLVNDAENEFRWKGHLMMPGIFDGEHYFMFESVSGNHTRFIHGEKFGGILIPFMGKLLTETEESFIQMNEALKERCESITENQTA